ncbi:dimethyl sulfoxide reductase [Georgenia sp. 311]|uniref:Dimethyl sulfoxide reductase n=1 Tax=Georgenia wutianyii TaxID=2585135 RepID=A0ABX5VNT3_9MICO|nr:MULTISPECIES: DmsC/YnfH family molybdoenzyme membrane anchor subunit [Georgenia]QDB78689.1 dimethyl sulfoxide reductase [Georgenia wutianyii]TNC18867.1 dimethyl sulfoxide reductase [Georgenia sp. 311]
MNVHELPMILFTVIAQMCVGTFIILGVVQLIASRRHDMRTVERLTEPVVYAIGPAMVLGLAASTLHMNDITNTLNVFRNVGTSWLSREIVFGIAFAALGFAFALLQWFKIGTIRVRQLVAAATALTGIALIWSMSQIYYSLQTVPAWNTPIVPLHFFATTLMLGALAAGCALMLTATIRNRRRPQTTDTEATSEATSEGNGEGTGEGTGGALATLVRTRVAQINAPTTTDEWTLTTRTVQYLAVASATIGVLVLASYPLHIADLATQGATTAAAVFSGTFFAIRLILLGIAAVILALFTYRAAGQARRENPIHLTTLMTAAFTLALIAELMGRSLHYDSMIRVGI